MNMIIRCNNCMRLFSDEQDLELLLSDGEWYSGCPKCLTDQFLMDLEVKSKDDARQQAIEWQSYFDNITMSYGDLIEWQAYFWRLGKKYGLLKEFRENCLI